ncbi:chlorophyll synthesis pathway protein BchC [Phaeovibrio sulfidiphilus]|uniref:Chlorophyll synthesis pathway protein BchC n=1 Tax=Phaeovibrio sulfidiphilus TaxID=1220600 RepID=A0A8J6YVP3_9PROT|nr:chlorophyll synthesis pathway protein BchC [Phaeovibrio sulfidiphilus]MBE1237274.1 chlorophyll synthesis pathway protein BchC [Phaeovibrio sulfidiphilus]
MEALCVVIVEPDTLEVKRLPLTPPSDSDVVVEIDYSGISTGTERLLYTGRMPPFPGMGYPLVPGYESVGRVIQAGPQSGRTVGERVFVPGATCYGEVRGLFGGAASKVVLPGARLVPLPDNMPEEKGVLFALAATAHHAVTLPGSRLPDLVVGHGVLGRLIARIVVALGGAPVVWEKNPARMDGAEGYRVVDPDQDDTKAYGTICDVSGDSNILDPLVARLAPGGEIVLAGFYTDPLHFIFPPAFMREARIRIAAQWKPSDVEGVLRLLSEGGLSLDGLITHRRTPREAKDAYDIAFTDPACLKMILDWRDAP